MALTKPLGYSQWNHGKIPHLLVGEELVHMVSHINFSSSPAYPPLPVSDIMASPGWPSWFHHPIALVADVFKYQNWWHVLPVWHALPSFWFLYPRTRHRRRGRNKAGDDVFPIQMPPNSNLTDELCCVLPATDGMCNVFISILFYIATRTIREREKKTTDCTNIIQLFYVAYSEVHTYGKKRQGNIYPLYTS